MKQSALVENSQRKGKRQRIIEMAKFLDEQSEVLEEYDEQLVRRLFEKMTVFEEKFTVEFKSGVECDVGMFGIYSIDLTAFKEAIA